MLAFKRSETRQLDLEQPASINDEIESMEAELSAMLVDLEARAKYGKIEGAAVPLLVRAKTVRDLIGQRLASASDGTRKRFGAEFSHLTGQLRTVAIALAYLCRSPSASPR